jgi:hypothetical protein
VVRVFYFDVPYRDRTSSFEILNTVHPNALSAASFFRSRSWPNRVR